MWESFMLIRMRLAMSFGDMCWCVGVKLALCGPSFRPVRAGRSLCLRLAALLTARESVHADTGKV